LANSLNEQFGDGIRLAGYEYDSRVLAPGDTLSVSLLWRALKGDLGDYEVQLRLLDETGAIRHTVASRPQTGQSPTEIWAEGQWIVDQHTLPISGSLPPGTYAVQVALEEVTTKKRLNIIADDGHWIDDRLLLSTIHIQQ
jgi:hypothetical protein